MNRLANETSPYLLQHAHNPVDWFPWGEEALARARDEDRPILVSIGYSACHWCHVMERESFENAEIAELLNRHFVPIKVDREERPDLDHIYMTAVQLLTGQGGWPLNMFCLPDGRPFYGGTYFPPDDRPLPPDGRQVMPGFKRLLEAIAGLYRTRRDEVEENAASLAEGMGKVHHFAPSGSAASSAWIERAAEQVVEAVDMRLGGVGRAPKFPNTSLFQLLLRAAHRTGRARYLEATRVTLERMAAGGIYDHLGGAFARYSTDDEWLVPHFEKMLYDEAQLAELYLDGWRATGDPRFRAVVEETVDFVLSDLGSPDGGFYSTFDADSEGEEGRYYVWTLDEVTEVLGAEEARIFARVYDITEEGNWEGKCIPRRLLDDDVAARYFGLAPDELGRRLADMRARLLERRRERVPPGRDEKVLTAWNGLMLAALARAAAAFERADWLERACANVAHVWERMRTDDGRLLRSYKDGRARFPGYLDDHAFYARGLLELFEAGFDRAQLERARSLGDVLLEHFEDREQGGFFFTAHDHETLVARTKSPFDSAIPSGNAAAIDVLLRLTELTGEARYADAALRALTTFGRGLEEQPLGLATMLAALDRSLAGATEVVLVGAADAPETLELLRALRGRYLPDLLVLVHDPAAGVDPLPVARDRPGLDGAPVAAYVCRGRTCSAPVRTREELESLL